jgi:MFS family permease
MVAIRKQTQGTAAPHATHPLIALTHRDFRLFWFGQVVSVAGTQMRQAAVAWQIYLLSHSALALGVLGLVRVAPIVLLSLFGGVIADAVDRRRLLLLTQTVLLGVSALLAAVTLAGGASIWSVYGLVALGTAAVAFDNPARQALVPSLVSRDHLSNALSLSTTTFQVAMVIGPSLAGFVIAAWGVSAVYVIDAISYLAVVIALLMIHPPPVVGAVQRVSVRAAVEGLQFVWREPILLSTMALDFVATFFGSASALLPIFAHDILHSGSQGYGVLYAAPAVGAIGAGIVMSFVALRIRNQGRVILLAVAAYSACTILFGLSHVFLLSVLFLAGTGVADTVSMILRQTVRQIVTPDALRGRMTSVSMVFFMGGPQLGEFEAGVVARGFGAPFSVVVGGVAALAATGIIAWRFVGLRHYRLHATD